MRRLVFLTGHYGSGKSEVAVNLAIRNHGGYLVDLDVVNPYFRSRESGIPLSEAGVEVISSPLKDGVYADMPFFQRTFSNRSSIAKNRPCLISVATTSARNCCDSTAI